LAVLVLQIIFTQLKYAQKQNAKW